MMLFLFYSVVEPLQTVLELDRHVQTALYFAQPNVDPTSLFEVSTPECLYPLTYCTGAVDMSRHALPDLPICNVNLLLTDYMQQEVIKCIACFYESMVCPWIILSSSICQNRLYWVDLCVNYCLSHSDSQSTIFSLYL